MDLDLTFGPQNFDSNGVGFDAFLGQPAYSEQFNHRVNDVPVKFYPRNYLKARYARAGIITNRFDQISTPSRAMHTAKEAY